MDASRKIQRSIHDVKLIVQFITVSRKLGTYHNLGAPPGVVLVPKAFAKEGGSTLGYRPLGCTFARTVGAVIWCAQPVHFTVDWLDWICYFT